MLRVPAKRSGAAGPVRDRQADAASSLSKLCHPIINTYSNSVLGLFRAPVAATPIRSSMAPPGRCSRLIVAIRPGPLAPADREAGGACAANAHKGMTPPASPPAGERSADRRAIAGRCCRSAGPFRSTPFGGMASAVGRCINVDRIIGRFHLRRIKAEIFSHRPPTWDPRPGRCRPTCHHSFKTCARPGIFSLAA